MCLNDIWGKITSLNGGLISNMFPSAYYGVVASLRNALQGLTPLVKEKKIFLEGCVRNVSQMMLIKDD